MSYDTSIAIKTGLVGASGVYISINRPSIITSNYVSYFDRIYDVFGIAISGDDGARLFGMAISLIVATNIIYNIFKDVRQRKAKRKAEQEPDSSPQK